MGICKYVYFLIENHLQNPKIDVSIPTDFEKNPTISCRVTGVDGQTDRPTDRRRAMAIKNSDKTIRHSRRGMPNN